MMRAQTTTGNRHIHLKFDSDHAVTRRGRPSALSARRPGSLFARIVWKLDACAKEGNRGSGNGLVAASQVTTSKIIRSSIFIDATNNARSDVVLRRRTGERVQMQMSPNHVDVPSVSSVVTENEIKSSDYMDSSESAFSFCVGVLPPTKSPSEIVVDFLGATGNVQVSSESFVIIIH